MNTALITAGVDHGTRRLSNCRDSRSSQCPGKDLTMSLTLLGAGVAVNTAFGAVFAPVSGRLSDRHGKWSCVLVLLSSVSAC